MLGHADEELAAHDRLLPDLRLLLDASACASLAGDRLGAPVTLRPRYLRYKPGTSCVMSAVVATPAGEQSWLIATYAAADAHKITKAVQRAPKGSVLLADPHRGLLIATAAADRDLPGLAVLHDRRRPRLLHRLLGECDLAAEDLRVRTVRHNPHRRWVGTLGAPNGPPTALLRVYRPGRMRAPIRAVAALARSDLHTPGLLGLHKRHGVAAVEFVPGVTLAELGCAPDDGRDSEGHRSAGEALAGLHSCTGVALRPTDGGVHARAVRKSADQLRSLMPETAAEVSAFADRLVARLQVMPSLGRPVHGDFSTDQVVIGHDGRARLIDLDSARLGDPAEDLGCAFAALARDVTLGGCRPESYERRRRALYEGYVGTGADLDTDRLATHEAAHLLRRAVEPFRLRRTPEWPTAAQAMVERAVDVLRTGSPTGALR